MLFIASVTITSATPAMIMETQTFSSAKSDSHKPSATIDINRPTVIPTSSSQDYNNSLLNNANLNYYNYYFILYRFIPNATPYIPVCNSIDNNAPLITFINYFMLYHLFDLYCNM